MCFYRLKEKHDLENTLFMLYGYYFESNDVIRVSVRRFVDNIELPLCDLMYHKACTDPLMQLLDAQLYLLHINDFFVITNEAEVIRLI